MPRSAASRPDESVRSRSRTRSRGSLTQCAAPASVALPVRPPRLVAVRGNLPPALVPHRGGRATIARQRTPNASSLRRTVTSVVELGPGSGEKLATLISARTVRNVPVHLVDVSSEALEQRVADARRSARSVGPHASGDLRSRPGVHRPVRRRLRLVTRRLSRLEHRKLRSARQPTRCSSPFARAVRRGDSLLLGADLVKPERGTRCSRTTTPLASRRHSTVTCSCV